MSPDFKLCTTCVSCMPSNRTTGLEQCDFDLEFQPALKDHVNIHVSGCLLLAYGNTEWTKSWNNIIKHQPIEQHQWYKLAKVKVFEWNIKCNFRLLPAQLHVEIKILYVLGP
jgi:hypothetical protein